jgi:membrane dipeptidase
VVRDGAALIAARDRPSIIVAAEGADFLEGSLDRLDEAQARYGLRHLQLTHYRVNEAGDNQTSPPKYDGLTPFGAGLVRDCNRKGIVVDVAHSSFAAVKRAASVTTKPLILSHTSLSARPKEGSRLVSVDHARAVAETGGVIGIWPPRSVFHDLAGFAHGFVAMVETVGIDHVGLGTDFNGIPGGSVFSGYAALPDVAAELLAAGFTPTDLTKLLGGNYARVFAATVG